MVFLGMIRAMPGGLRQLFTRLNFFGPDPFGTFVVAHNYGLTQNDRDCDGNPGHPAPDGLNNLDRSSTIDYRRHKCFDTAPFRDRASYQKSQYIGMFQARGAFFMGCKNAQADDPTIAGQPLAPGDKNTKKVLCE
jgi:hypothetical protein